MKVFNREIQYFQTKLKAANKALKEEKQKQTLDYVGQKIKERERVEGANSLSHAIEEEKERTNWHIRQKIN